MVKCGMKLLIHSQTSMIAAVEAWEWISNFIPHWVCNYLFMLGIKLIIVSKRGPCSLWCCNLNMNILSVKKAAPNRLYLLWYTGVQHLKDIFCQALSAIWTHSPLNSLGPSDTIWRQISGSTLAQVMAYCLMAPSHYLNQCWLILSKVQWHSYDGNFIRDTSAISH